jgi:hypothetical protein
MGWAEVSNLFGFDLVLEACQWWYPEYSITFIEPSFFFSLNL